VDRFEGFRLHRNELRDRYQRLAGAVLTECGGPVDAEDLPFRLVESVINRRSDDGVCPPDQPWIIADGALRALGYDGDLAALRRSTAARLALHIEALT
jgi:hypothetical protein